MPQPRVSERPAVLRTTEIQTVLRSLRKRFINQAFPDVHSVGIGIASKANLPDPFRGISAIFYVGKSKLSRHAGKRIPWPTVTVTVRRRGRRKTIKLPTDVVCTKNVILTGSELDVPKGPGRRDDCTGGVKIEWLQVGDPIAKQGLLTIGHAAAFSNQLTTAEQSVAVDSSPGVGFFLEKADIATTRLDVALVELNVPTLVSSPHGFQVSTSPRSIAMARADFGRSGRSWRAVSHGGMVNLTIQDYAPTFFVNGLGSVRDVIRVHSSTNSAFRPRTSGSAWTVIDQAGNEFLLALQVAADGNDNFRTGYGQLLASGSLQWALDYANQQFGVVFSSAAMLGYF